MSLNLPSRVWEVDYRHDRRKHRHRCFKCNRIINTGERIVMCRMYRSRKTKAAHIDCASTPHLPGKKMTTREVMEVWSSPPDLKYR